MSAVIQECDVAIIGAGLAGATLALQLKAAKPELSIAVFERNSLPPPHAAHKVGESTVEIGSHYLSHTLGLKELLDKTQLRKFGLRFFFDAAHRPDISQADELGASDYFNTTSYQLDRGVFEGSLAGLLQQRGIHLQPESRVKSIKLADGNGLHQLKLQQHESEQLWNSRWVIDAAARAGLLKRQLNLGRKVPHKACSAWFRLDTVISVDDWSSNPEWQARCQDPRRLSTNHLMGAGYWLWVIPLVGNRTSIGLVADPDIHPLEQFNSLPRFLAWTREHQPAMADRLEAVQSSLMDFHFLRDLSRDCRKIWSAEGWAMAGESGLFADPFYSPGTDYIGIGNRYITDLVTGGWSPTELQQRSVVFNALFRSFFGSTMSLYQNQYAGFGDLRLMAVKSTWDYAYYWSILAWMFFRDVQTDLPFMQNCEADFRAVLNLNADMQALFRDRASQRITTAGAGRFIDQLAIPVLQLFNQALIEPQFELMQELKHNRNVLEALVPLLENLLAGSPASSAQDCSLLGDLAKRLM